MIQAHCLTSQPVRSLPGQTRTLKNSRISGSPVLRRQQSPISKLNVREAGRVAPPTVKTKATSSNASGVQQQDRDLKHIVQKFCPVFVFHPKEKYFCCTPEFFVEKSELITHRNDSVDMVLNKEDTTWEAVDEITSKANLDDGYRMRIADKSSRRGMVSGNLSDVPLFAKIKRVKVSGELVLEINYMGLLAFSGPYRYFFGAHDGDWEHITVRCTTEGELISVYYGAHRHQDGQWLKAKDCPVDGNTGRLLAFICLNGHGIYPTTGVHYRPRTYYLANDETSSKGRVWGSKECIILAYPNGALTDGHVLPWKLGRIRSDRGNSYNETGEPTTFSPALNQTWNDDQPAKVEDVEVSVPGTDWLRWKCRWGTVVPPWEQMWFREAEHPTGK